MNKIIKKLLILPILFLVFISTVSANINFFDLEFETNKETIDTETNMNITDNNYGYQDGYITSHLILEEESIKSILTYYSNTGTKVMEKTFNDTIFLNLITNNKDIYSIIVKPPKECPVPEDLSLKSLLDLEETCGVETYKLVNMNEKLDIKKELILDLSPEDLLYQELLKILGFDTISITDNEIALFLSNGLKVADKDLTHYDNFDQTTPNIKKYFNDLGETFDSFLDFTEKLVLILEEEDPTEIFKKLETISPLNINLSTFTNSNYKVTSGLEFDTKINKKANEAYAATIKLPNEENDIYLSLSGTLKLQDKNNKVIFSQKSSNYIAYLNTTIMNNYIVTIGINLDVKEDIFTNEESYDSSNITTDILIYDLNGNLLQTINNNSMHLNLHSTKDSFIVTNLEEEISNSKIYHMNNRINTKVEGKGTIKVLSASRPGSPVTFEITPKKGYKLDKILVLDSNGNQLEFNSNTFTMPNSDITIVATFVVENPNTSAISIIALIFLSVTCILVAIKSHYKLKWLKG